MTTPTTAELVIWLRNMAIGLRASGEPTHDNDKGFDFAADRLSEMEGENKSLALHLDKTVAVAADALKRVDEREMEIAHLRELRRVSFMQMLAILRQNGDRLEIYNSALSDVDPLFDTIIHSRSDANDSFVLERRAALNHQQKGETP